TEIEQAVFVELTHRGAVRATDILGVDLEFGARIAACQLGQQQAVVALDGIGAIGARSDKDASAEHAATAISQNAAIVFVAGAVRLRMTDKRVVIHMPLAVRNVCAVEQAFRSLTVET